MCNIFENDVVVNRICSFMDFRDMQRVIKVNKCFYDEGYSYLVDLMIKKFFGSHVRTVKSIKSRHLLKYIKNRLTSLIPNLDPKTAGVNSIHDPNDIPLRSEIHKFDLYLYFPERGWCQQELSDEVRNTLKRTFNTKNFSVTLYSGQMYDGYGAYLFNDTTQIPYFFQYNVKRIEYIDLKDDILLFQIYTKHDSTHLNINCATMSISQNT